MIRNIFLSGLVLSTGCLSDIEEHSEYIKYCKKECVGHEEFRVYSDGRCECSLVDLDTKQFSITADEARKMRDDSFIKRMEEIEAAIKNAANKGDDHFRVIFQSKIYVDRVVKYFKERKFNVHIETVKDDDQTILWHYVTINW